MFSPEGFTPVSEVHRRSPIEHGMYPTMLMSLLAQQASIYVCSRQGLPLKVDSRILAVFGATYLLIDPELWVVSFERIRRSAWNESHCLGGVNYEKPPEIDLVGLVRRFKGRTYTKNPLPDNIPDDITDAIMSLEGLPIILREDDADKMIAALERAASSNVKRNLSPNGEGRHAFLAFLASVPERAPTEQERDDWSKMNLRGGREAGRDLWRELKPADGSKPGPKTYKR